MNVPNPTMTPTFVPTVRADAAAPGFPFDLRWNAQQLADAVPLRLFELLDFDALRDGAVACANHGAPRRHWRAGYASTAALPAHVRVR